MSSSNSEEQTIQDVKVLYEVESFSSEEPPIEEWSSLNAEIPEENVKRILYEQGFYSPGSGEICAKYIPLSASSVFRHPYYNYPAVHDPGIKEALLDPPPRTLYSHDGQELYLDLCKEMGICPIRSFYRQLLDREIDLRYYGIHPMGFRAIAMALSNNRIVKVLDLTDNWISEDGCYHLGEMLVTNISLEELNLHGCRIGAEGARRLFASMHVNRTLRKIDLTKNCLTDDGVEHLSKAIVFGSDVTNINLSYNSLSAKSLASLTTAFETHNKLTHLNLSWNTIFSPAAVFNLCNMLSENTKLEEVNLSWNSLSGARVGTAIKQLMKAPNLKSLYLYNNKLSAEVTQIARSLPSSKLTTLDLSYNPLTPEHALFLLSYLKNRRVKIQTLFLENVMVTAEFIELKDKILSLKFRKNAVITCGEILPKYFSKSGDMREIVLKRAEFLCSKSKKSAVDIALIILEIHKNNKEPMEIKGFSQTLKSFGASGLDEDLIEEIANSFPGPTIKKVKMVDLVKLVDYVHRKWPEKKLPPTPPPEVPERWQRRWFVLYDDGELTYSLDEHPDTVPQASVDMTTVLEVSDADSVTGHPHSLAITAPERVTFVKGTCREEARWWADVLSVYPRSKGRHKRNATFPGGQTGSLLQSSTTRKYSADASTLRDAADSARPRFCGGGTTTWPGPRVQPPQPEIASMAVPTNIDTKVYTDQPVSSASPPTRDKINGEEKARSRRRDTWPEPTTAPSTDEVNVVRSPLLQQQHQQYDEQLRDIAASLTRPRSRRALPPTLERPTRLPPPDRLPARGAPDGGPPPEEGITSSASEGSETTDAVEATESTEGGRVELPAERLLHARAGWLQRRSPSGWSRHWFVLRGAALLYFRDPHAEHRGLMDGVIDLSGISRVVELPGSANGYAFETVTWDGKHIVLSAVTAGIRANWVSAMKRTAGLPDSGPLSLILREDSVDQVSESSTSPITPVTPNTTKTGPFSSDEEYRTASEGGRRDSADWGDVSTQPPPSPILNRTPISKVKEKVRARACLQPQTKPELKVDKDEIDSTKEKENLPLDEVDENEKPNEPRKRSYISTIDKQTIEIEDLRKQLKLALNDVNAAESELARLRKLKSEAATREKKMEELVITLQKKEEELSIRTKEAENLNTIKQLYNTDKNMWETKLTETQNFLKESTEHCELLTRQLTTAQETIKQLQKELNELNEKLLRSVRENDSLYSRIRELESKFVAESPTREKRKSIGSLSDLSNINQDLNIESLEKNRLIDEYIELRSRFLKAIQEIKAMKRELRDSHNMYDELEVTNTKLINEMKLREQCSTAEIDLMAARILDLTQKLTASDKQVRTLKHKIQKTESREKRRSLSLKGRESFTLGKEVEEKLTELENKITLLETGESVPTINTPSKSASPAKEKVSKTDTSTDDKRMKRLAARLRRKSLDSATSSEPMKMLVRLSSLETKVASALESRRDLTISCESLSPVTRSSESPPSNDSPESSTMGTQSQRHLLDRLQSLENVVIHSRNKVNECLCQMSAMRAAKSRRSPSPSLEKKYSIKAMEKCLMDVSKRLQECFDKCVTDPTERSAGDDADDGIAQVVVQLEEQLRAKLLEISRRKAALYEAGELTQRKSLEILAEKLAYEAVLVGRIQEALESSDGSRFFARLVKSEIIETSQLIDNLKSKLNGEGNVTSVTKSSLDYLARILSRKIDASGGREPGARRTEVIIQSAELEALKASQREVGEAVERYKREKLGELCAALAGEAPSPAASDSDAERSGAEAARVREAWASARDALGAELVQAEVARALGRAAQLCEDSLGDARRARLALSAQHRADLNLWWQAAHDHLRCEMDAAVRDIAAQVRADGAAPAPAPRAALDSRALLAQLADVLARKALVDARVAVLEGTYRASGEAQGRADDALASLETDPASEAEFVFLFQHFSTECRALFSGDCSGNSDDSMKIGESLERVEAAVAAARRRLAPDDDAQADAPGEPRAGLVERLEALRRRVEALQCPQCARLQEALERLTAERARSECALTQQAAALAAARRARAQLQAQHERERVALRERARTLQRRLAALDSEYSAQLDSLRAAYQSAVSADTHGDSLRARYQQEIEQLRALCEKGLLAMESSHRRIVREMEDKHRAERDQLRLEKEQALAEETRATLAALDAMRKAHENEVRREVDKFKTEFLARGAPELGQLSSRHQQEMEEIKREILSLSEKYSVKCVESAALEERLAAASAQLAHAHNHIMQLDARNKQLRAHIMSEANEMKNSEASTLAHLIEDSPPGRSPRSSGLERSRAPPSPFGSPETTRSLQMSPVQN